MVLAAYLTTAFVVGAVGALHLLRDRANPARAADVLDGDVDGAVVAPIQIFAGDAHGLNTLRAPARQGRRRWRAISRASPTARR